MTTAFDSTTLALLEEHVRRLLGTMGFAEVSVRCRAFEAEGAPVAAAEDALTRNAALETPARRSKAAHQQGQLKIDIEAGEEGRLLIGTQGNHLEALQHVIRTLLRRHLQTPIHISVDVNGYHLRREESLIQLAEAAARRATQEGKIIELKPMGAADRRAIHTTLANRADVTTESRGEEPQRRVAIRPVF